MVAAGRQFYQQVTCIQEKRLESGCLAKQGRLDTGSQERKEYELGGGNGRRETVGVTMDLRWW